MTPPKNPPSTPPMTPPMTPLLIENAEIDGARAALRIREGRIADLGPKLRPEPGEARLDARDGALLPGLHDHHIHLLALAAARDSVACGPPAVRNASELGAALEEAASQARHREGSARWVRGVAYHESVAGPLDRRRIDALVDDVPIRIQHRSGVFWFVNSKGLAALNLASDGPEKASSDPDAEDRANGRLRRADPWLRERIGSTRPPALGEVGAELARLGVTGVCDATPSNGPEAWALLAAAKASGELPQRLRVMGDPSLPLRRTASMQCGELKIMLDEDHLPEEHALVEKIQRAHRDRRGVAFHCVTRAEIVMAAAALESAGGGPGDRIEHASLAPPDIVAWLARLGVTVVTQPNFLLERGDVYRREVPRHDQPWLYRGQGFIEAQVPLGGGTDAPFGVCDPWAAMRAAVRRRSAEGAGMRVEEEALTPEQALGLFTSSLDSPGQPRGPLAVGQPADLILLDRPWSQARLRLAPEDLSAVWIDGKRVWERGTPAPEPLTPS
ncbi:MAG: amidohydrolase family protein [Myxococcota bacterium]|nr:amidohydrolase family protein [Myxococcota bacterium]